MTSCATEKPEVDVGVLVKVALVAHKIKLLTLERNTRPEITPCIGDTIT